MILVVDANILIRMVVGKRAPEDARMAVARGVELITTARQLDEAAGVLGDVFRLEPDDIIEQLLRVADLMSVSGPEGYAHLQAEAVRRLRWTAEGDWPVLAAALAFAAGIWSDDRDFFGTGVPVWSSPNIERARANDLPSGDNDARPL